LKIWHITKTLLGGAGQYALHLSDALRAAGLESTVLLKEGPGPNGTIMLKKDGSPLRDFAARVFRSLSHRIALGPWHSIRGLELYEVPLAISPGDIIHLHGLTDWIGVAGLERLIPRDARVFQTAHGGWEVSCGCVVRCGTECQGFATGCAGCPALRRPWKFLARMELKAKCRFVNKHRIHPIANSSWTARIIQRSPVYPAAPNVPILHPSLHPAFVNSDGKGARASFGIPDDTFVIGLGARAVTDPYKGIAEFLQRLSTINELVSRTTVLLFGDGKIPCPANLKVRGLGAVTEPEVLAKILSASDVFVSPSGVESFGMLLMEAQAVGTPVLGFDVGGTADAVFPGMRQNLMPLHRWDLLFENVRRLVRGTGPDHGLLERMRTWARETFAPSGIAKKQLQIYGIGSGVV